MATTETTSAPAAPAAPSPSPAPAAAPPSAPPSTAPNRLSDLTSDFIPGKGEREPVPPSPSPTPTPEPTEPQPAPATPPAALPERVKIRGIEYSIDEVLQNDALRQSLLQTYDQFPALQRKYVEILEQLRQEQIQSRRQPAQPQAAPADPRVQQGQLRMHYEPELRNVVNAGFVEEDVATLYPNLVTQLLAHRDLLYSLRDQFNTFTSGYSDTTRETERTTRVAKLETDLDALAAKGEVWAPLKTPAEREGFLTWLVQEINPPVDRITPEFLARQWFAFKHETVLSAAQAVTTREQQDRETARRRAVGDGRGTRPAAPAPAAPTHLDELIGDRLPRR